MLMQQNVIVAMQSAVLIALCRFLEVSIHNIINLVLCILAAKLLRLHIIISKSNDYNLPFARLDLTKSMGAKICFN